MEFRRVDLAIAGAVTAATVIPVLVPSPRAWWVIGLAVLASVPVYWVRRAPIWASLVVGLAMTAMVLWEKPLLPFGPLVGLYTIAAQSTKTQRLVVVPVTAVIVTASLLVPHEDSEAWRFVGTSFVAAYALGLGTRARRARAAEMAERARRVAVERARAAAEERTRIARDVHDIVTHSVGLMVVQAEAGPVVLRSDPARAEHAFDTIAETGRAALLQLRGLIGTLRAERPGLAALPQLVERIARTGLRVDLVADGEPRPVPDEVDVAAYRIVQEALTNVLRHSSAQAVRIRLAWGEVLHVEIADDGGLVRAEPGGHGLKEMRERGEPGTFGQRRMPERAESGGFGLGGIRERGESGGFGLRESGGFGLRGMRERVEACGGKFRAGAGAGGFVVSAELPVG
ncbi:sensor histidine kinase [Nonomuraea sediminis]|uniref:sensor histidine kinase n=1 Tax=Nonomuraea sediminis TaxID=2835864 RepID=UPI001BDBB315|nr:histidine kinase [Nonomuraea sediminis]